MNDLFLDVHGVTARIGGDADALARISVHFGAFRSRSAAEPCFRVELLRQAPSLDVPTRLTSDQVVDRGVVYNAGSTTWVDHHGQAVSCYDFATERGRILAPQVEDLVELGYLMVHSRLGVHLERRGLYRLHCLGIVIDGKAALVLSPSGGGKSRLALSVLSTTDAKLLGDDLVLVDRRGRVHPFHSPIGVSKPEHGKPLGVVHAFHRRLHPPKWIVELDPSERLARSAAEVRLVAIAKRASSGPSALVPVRRAAMQAALWRDLVVGLGLPQVLELVARRGARDLVSFAPTALSRMRAARALARKAQAATLELADPDAAAELLVRRLAAEPPCA